TVRQPALCGYHGLDAESLREILCQPADDPRSSACSRTCGPLPRWPLPEPLRSERPQSQSCPTQNPAPIRRGEKLNLVAVQSQRLRVATIALDPRPVRSPHESLRAECVVKTSDLVVRVPIRIRLSGQQP